MTKLPKCKSCHQLFEPKRFLQKVCSPLCSIAWSKTDEGKKSVWKVQKSELKTATKTKGDYLKELQIIFNQFIRLRDNGKPCISCGAKWTAEFQCGHYYSVGAYPNLRYHEDNSASQCVACNYHKSGNQAEYALNLPFRISQDRIDELNRLRTLPLKLSIVEIEELKQYYRNKIKGLKP